MRLAGGTVLFPYGSSTLRRLRDLTGVGWEPWTVRDEGLEIAATCTIAQLYALPGTAAPYELVRTGAVATPRAPGFPAAEQWPATALIRPCCDSFVASFEIWNVSTVGGNIATALPAGPMTSLFAGLDAVATVWARRTVPVAELAIGDGRTSLTSGELMRSLLVPREALASRAACRPWLEPGGQLLRIRISSVTSLLLIHRRG